MTRINNNKSACCLLALFLSFSLLHSSFASLLYPSPSPSPDLAATADTSPSPDTASPSPDTGSPSPTPSPSLPPSPSHSISSPPAPPPSDLRSPSPAPAPISRSSPAPAPSKEAPSDISKSNSADVAAEEEKGEGMSVGKKFGVAFGVIAVAFVVGAGVLVYRRRQYNMRRAQYSYAARREIL